MQYRTAYWYLWRPPSLGVRCCPPPAASFERRVFNLGAGLSVHLSLHIAMTLRRFPSPPWKRLYGKELSFRRRPLRLMSSPPCQTLFTCTHQGGIYREREVWLRGQTGVSPSVVGDFVEGQKIQIYQLLASASNQPTGTTVETSLQALVCHPRLFTYFTV